MSLRGAKATKQSGKKDGLLEYWIASATGCLAKTGGTKLKPRKDGEGGAEVVVRAQSL